MAEATGETFGGMLDVIDSSFEKLGPAEGLKRFVNRYLSDGHVKGPGSGCVVAALGSESARAGPAVCKTFAERIRKQIEILSSVFEGTSTERRAKAARLFATLLGAVVIAQAAGGDRLANHVLSACREDFQNGAT